MAGSHEDSFTPLEDAARAWADVSAQTVRRMCGLAAEPWSVAAALYRHGMLPQSRLVSLCHTHKVMISRAVDTLVRQKQWVARLPAGKDARVRHLILTEKGRAEVAVVARALADLRDQCLAQIGEGEVAHLQALQLRIEAGVRHAAPFALSTAPCQPRPQAIQVPERPRAEIRSA
jgi:DNA-binding MarR family transcriptional regulator